MNIRNLRGDDVFLVLNILGKLELKDELVKVFNEFGGDNGKQKKKMTDEEIQQRGMAVMAALLQQVLKNILVVKDDVNALLADLTETSIEDIKGLGAGAYTKLLIQLFKNPEIKEVFTSAASLMTDETASTN